MVDQGKLIQVKASYKLSPSAKAKTSPAAKAKRSPAAKAKTSSAKAAKAKRSPKRKAPAKKAKKSTVTINLKTEDSDEILSKVLNYASEKEKASSAPLRIHFWGSEHWDDRIFDALSGKLEIAVLAKDSDAAVAMLVVLKYIIDRRENANSDLEFNLEMEAGGGREIDETTIPVETASKLLSALSDGYRVTFNLEDTYTSKYHEMEKDYKYITKTITQTFQDVDVYNIQRLSIWRLENLY